MGFTVISHTILRWKHAMASPFLCCFGLSSAGGGGLKKRWDSDDGLSDLDLAASRTITCHAQVQPEVRVTSSSSSSPGTDEVGVPFAVILQKQQQSCLQDLSLSVGVNVSNPAAGFLHTTPVIEVRSLLPAQSNAASVSPISTSAPQSSTSTTYSSAHDDVEEERKNGEHRLRLLGVLPNNPFKPEFATIEARLGTFMGNNWPLDSQSGYPTAEQLAEAGLYYLGVRDSVKCFFCDGRLRRWAPHDDAWVEHARWYPDCAFVHNVKGRHFIDAVLAQERMRLSCVASTAASSSTSSSSSGDEISHSITTCSQHSTESSEHAREISCNRVTPEPENSSLAEFPASNNTDQTTSSQRPSAAPPACKICLDRDVCIAFLPCGHLSACAQCAPALQQCPICRTQILSTVRTYLV